MAAARQIAQSIREGKALTDETFDALLTEGQRALSRQYWTPVSVACRVAEWLSEEGASSLLDIGSGVGKLCCIVSLRSERMTQAIGTIGLEQREDLASAARFLAATLGVDSRTRFIHAALGEVALPRVDAYYLFNPFGENLLGREGQIDQTLDFSEARFRQDVGLVQRLLRVADSGTCLVTYNGFGGVIPRGYVDRRVERHGLNDLVLWRKS